MMRKVPVFFLALLLGLTSIGCDSGGDDEPDDAEIFIGTWNMVSISDADGDKTGLLTTIANSFQATLTALKAVTISVDYKEGSGFEDLVIPGTYSVDAGAKKLIVTPPTGQNIPFDYVIESDTRIRLSTAADFMNALFGSTAYSGTVVIVIEKAS